MALFLARLAAFAQDVEADVHEARGPRHMLSARACGSGGACARVPCASLTRAIFEPQIKSAARMEAASSGSSKCCEVESSPPAAASAFCPPGDHILGVRPRRAG
jgi:hypothetical protein